MTTRTRSGMSKIKRISATENETNTITTTAMIATTNITTTLERGNKTEKTPSKVTTSWMGAWKEKCKEFNKA